MHLEIIKKSFDTHKEDFSKSKDGERTISSVKIRHWFHEQKKLAKMQDVFAIRLYLLTSINC